MVVGWLTGGVVPNFFSKSATHAGPVFAGSILWVFVSFSGWYTY